LPIAYCLLSIAYCLLSIFYRKKNYKNKTITESLKNRITE